jgi:predicted N-acetyltransferase YhbS
MDLTVRPITQDEVPAFRQQLARGFGHDVREADHERFSKVFETPRLIAAFDGADIVGSCGAFSFDVTVPGGALPMGGTTIVTVLPTHRRRGVLRAMMREHLAEVRAHEEPLAGLWASEASIYGRFGYGLTVEACKMTVDAHSVTFIDHDPARCRWLDPADAHAVLPPLFAWFATIVELNTLRPPLYISMAPPYAPRFPAMIAFVTWKSSTSAP